MKNLAIFASGSGTNAENLVRLFNNGNRVHVAVVLCNRRGAGVFARMEALGVPCIYIPSSVWDTDPQQIIDTLKPYHIDLVVLAGFMRTIRPELVAAYRDRMVNIHPSLLPAYGGKGMYGHHVHEAVIAAGEKQSGVTVHYVSDQIDGGKIVMQQSVDITPDDTPQTLEDKIHPVEYSLYPRAILAALSDQDSDTPEQAWASALKVKYDATQAAERAAALKASQAQTPSQPSQMQAAPGKSATQADSVQRLTSTKTQRTSGYTDTQEIPKSYMVWSVLVTILCCTIPGIIAVIYSSSVNSRILTGDIQGAHKASIKAQGWIIASFILGMLSATLWFPILLISSMW